MCNYKKVKKSDVTYKYNGWTIRYIFKIAFAKHQGIAQLQARAQS